MRYVVRILTIGLIVVATAAAMAQAPALDAEVESALGAAAWTDTTAAHVRLQRTPWRGPDDLSLRYRLTVHEGVFYLQARVRDDRPCLGEGAALVSDHLEVWLADPAVVQEIDTLRTEVDSLIQDMTPSGETPPGEESVFVRSLIRSLNATRHALRRPLGLTQLRLHPGACAADPEPVAGAVRHLFRHEAGGYSVWLRVELAGAISRGGATLSGLLYLVDALDVDDPAATVQEKLVSSSTSRRWADPATFPEMAFGTPVRLPITDDAARLAKLVPGYLRLAGGALQWVARGEDPQSGSYGVERMLLPAPYAPPAVTRLVDEPDWRLWLFEQQLLSGPGEGEVTDLDERIGAAGGWTYGLLDRAAGDGCVYVLLFVIGCSRYPGGSTMCGAGTEGDLIWLCLSPDGKARNVQSVRYESCFESIGSDEMEPNGGIRGEPMYTGGDGGCEYEFQPVLRDGRLALVTTRYGRDGRQERTAIRYDRRHPERGLIVEPLPR
ncbi:MAG TPA: hypothetical protein PLY66_16070 [Acidobacteriota bacterium]|nr:hypothetical protein [Acidobacteriota bacterium]HQF87531.1 hypothetical protein [Acidobacteriota bacterium]HQG92723.1 hypothetical protein [Acidobacteriota bacterium]